MKATKVLVWVTSRGTRNQWSIWNSFKLIGNTGIIQVNSALILSATQSLLGRVCLHWGFVLEAHTHLAKYDFVYPGFLLYCSVHKFYKPVLKIINRVKSTCAQHPRTTTGISEQQAAILGILKWCILKPVLSGSLQNLPGESFPQWVCWNWIPNNTTQESRKVLLLSNSPGCFQESRRDTPILLPRLPCYTHCASFPRRSLKQDFDSFRQNECPDSCQGNKSCMSKTILHITCWGVTIPKQAQEKWVFCSLWQEPLLSHRVLLTPMWEHPECCRTCCSYAQQTLLSLEARRAVTE